MQQSRAEPVAAGRLVLLDELDPLQRAENPVRGAPRQTERVGYLRETVMAGATRQEPQHGCGSFDRLDGSRHGGKRN